MRSQILLLATLLTPAGLFADQWTHHWAVTGTPELKVTAGDAAVEVKSGPGEGIDAKVETNGWKIDSSGIRIEEHQSGNRVEIAVKFPHFQFNVNGNHNVRVEVRVPRDLSADLRTGDGPILLKSLHGTVHAVTGDGPVRVEQYDGTLQVQTGDGPVSLQGVFRGLEVQTGDGPVEVTAERGSEMRNGWHVQTGDGPVSIKVPESLNANVNLHTGDGPMRLDLPVTVNGVANRNHMEGKLNGGGPELTIHTGDGPITLGRS